MREREQREVSVGNTQSRRELVGQREVSVGNTQARREQSRGTYGCVSLCVCLCVRALTCVSACASVCGRGERDRDIPEAREAGELGRRQARQLVVVQPEGPVGNTPSKERARAHACQPMRVSAGPRTRVTQAAGACHSRAMRMRVCAGPVCARVCMHPVSEGKGGRQRTTSADSLEGAHVGKGVVGARCDGLVI